MFSSATRHTSWNVLRYFAGPNICFRIYELKEMSFLFFRHCKTILISDYFSDISQIEFSRFLFDLHG